MNLVRAISLGGAGELRGNDSTTFICHVQLIILAIDCILNIVVDNFLREPLIVLIIFICQAFLLVIGLILYLMASANQAMKQGIHEKLLRHHQVTIILWTIYFSMLIWWYIWTLKRSWPSAGDYFSFGPSSPEITTTPETTTILPIKFNVSDNMQSTIPQLAAITAVTAITRAATTTKPKTTTTRALVNTTIRIHTNESTVHSAIDETLNETLLNVDMIVSVTKNKTMDSFILENVTEEITTGNSAVALLASYKLITDTPSSFNEILEMNSQEEDSEATPIAAASSTNPKMAVDSNLKSMNSTKHNVHSDSVRVSDSEEIFFWSPGFIAVYTVERSVSLFFYVAYILGTLHIVNAHLMDEDTGDKALHHVSGRLRNKNNNIKTKSAHYDSPAKYNSKRTSSPGYIESDSNFDDNGDNFIRQLEEQDGDPHDPFENAQYQYQYRNTSSLYPYSHDRNMRTVHNVGTVETSDGEGAEDGSMRSSGTDAEVRGDGGRGKIGKKNRKQRKNAGARRDKENFESRARSAFKLKSPKAKMSKEGLRNMMMMAELGNTNMKADGIYMTPGNSLTENPAIVTASVDSVAGSGSTDELLVAEVFARGDSKSYYQTGNEAFDHHESEESDGRATKKDYATRFSPVHRRT